MLRVLVLLVLLLAGMGLADQPQIPPANTAQQESLFRTFFDINRWLQSISRDVARLEAGISGLALALVLLGFVYGIVQGIAGGGLEAIKGAFVRLAVVGLLLSLWNSGFVGNTLDRAMMAAREWGVDASANTLADAGDSLDALAMRIVPFMGAVGAIKLMAAKVAENAAKNVTTRTVASGMSAGASKVMQYLNWATLLLIPFMLFFFILIVVASFTVEIGVALFPLAAALLIFPKGSAADWFGKWIGAVVGALLIVLLLPIGFKAAVEMGINRPVNQVNAYVEQALGRIEAQKEAGLDAVLYALDNCRVWDAVCRLDQTLQSLRIRLEAVWQQITTAVQAWLLGVILLVAGMAAAAYVLFNVERVAMSFVGGLVATGVRQMLGTSSLGGRVYGGLSAANASTVRDEPSFRMPAGRLPPGGPPGGLPRPAAYEVQPYYGGRGYGDDDIIEGEWRPAPPELPAAGNPRALPAGNPRGLPPGNPRGLPGPSSD
jgi:hypothetical protein